MAEKIQNKYIVFKNEDFCAAEITSPHIKCAMSMVRIAIEAHRRSIGKSEDNYYIVCNQDEPYAQSVWDVILSGEDGVDELTAIRARVAKLEVCARIYLLALELYLPSAIGVLGESDLAGALRAAEKDLRRVLEEK